MASYSRRPHSRPRSGSRSRSGWRSRSSLRCIPHMSYVNKNLAGTNRTELLQSHRACLVLKSENFTYVVVNSFLGVNDIGSQTNCT